MLTSTYNMMCDNKNNVLKGIMGGFTEEVTSNLRSKGQEYSQAKVPAGEKMECQQIS